MAAKVFLILALFAAVAYAADTDCKCDRPSETENSALWEFLKKLSEQVPDEKDRLDAVLPAVLSPLLDCNCLQDKTRRKRKVLPEVSVPEVSVPEVSVPEVSVPEVSEETYLSEESIAERRDPKCPHGTVWFGIMCVNEQFVMDK